MKSLTRLLLGALMVGGCALPSAYAHAAVPDTMVVTDKFRGETNYPLQFGRPFVKGEIANYPQVLANGAPLLTQADVKNRWPDGSVKFAVISVVLPSIQANNSVVLSFQNQTSGNNTALTPAQMLDSAYDFDATISLSNGTQTVSASARQMLQSGSYIYWTSGAVATTILLADDSLSRAYDLGFDALRPMRPRFYATFWPATHQVFIRAIGEDTNTAALEDITGNLSITIGSASPRMVYTKSKLTIYSGTRWNKTFWLGSTPQQQVNIDNNLPYLSQTYFIPNYDPSQRSKYAETQISKEWTHWLGRPKDLYDAGLLTPFMGQTGGRADIGIYPKWMMDWLYTGDWRLKAIALGQADLGDAWPAHYRQGTSAYYDQAQTVPGLGKTVSVYEYPTSYPMGATRVNAKFINGANWDYEGSHAPELYSLPYLLTGDYFYLEQLQNWAAMDAVNYNACGKTQNINCRGRGSNPVVAAVHDQIRGNAWVLRTRARAALLSPDGTPEQAYFSWIINDAVATWEAERGISDPALQALDPAAWAYGVSGAPIEFAASPTHTPSPLHFFDQGAHPSGSNPADFFTDGNDWYTAPWAMYCFMAVLGNINEYGFSQGQPLMHWLSPLITGQIAVSQQTGGGTYDARFIAAYIVPVRDGVTNQYFSSWTDIQNEYLQTNKDRIISHYPNQYATAARAAATFLLDVPGGAAAWSWLQQNTTGVDTDFFGLGPMLPRSRAINPVPSAITTPTR